MRRQYERRRDALLTGMRANLPWLDVAGVAAGLHLLIRLPGPDAEARAIRYLRDRDIWTTPLSRYNHRATAAGIVVGFARLPVHHAAAISAELADAIRGP